MSVDKVTEYAEECFYKRMERYGFSFTQSGLCKVAFDDDGRLYNNWQPRTKECRPSAVEHPLLCRSLQMFGKKRKEASIPMESMR